MTAIWMTSSAPVVLMSGAQVLLFDVYGGESCRHVAAEAKGPSVSTCPNTPNAT